MLGLRGVRLGIAIPGLFEMQSQAILEAAAIVVERGGHAQPEIMVPLVGAVEELRNIRAEIDDAAHRARQKHSVHLDHLVGTMIELPRAALTAGDIAEAADFFSFGTNDLTQTTWGFSRDDVESSFFSRYMEAGILGVSPFETIDRAGRRSAGADRHRRGPQGQARAQGRGVRRARGRPRVGALLRGARPGLRVVLAVPGARRPARGRPGRASARSSAELTARARPGRGSP